MKRPRMGNGGKIAAPCVGSTGNIVQGLQMPASRLRVVWWLAVFLPTALQAQTTAKRVTVTASPVPSVQEIVQRALANDELRRQHRLALECDQTITVDRLDERGEAFKSKTLHTVYREKPALAYATDVDLPPEGQAHHGHRDGDIAKADHRLALLNLRQLAPRFDYTLTGEATVRGRDCYVIEYVPRSGQRANAREEKAVNQLHGRFWIDKKSWEILQGEGSLAAPVSVALLSAVTRLDFAFRTQPMPNGEAGPADFSVDLAVKAPFYFYHQQQTARMENWRSARE